MTIPQRIYNQALSDGMPQQLAQLISAQSGHETAGWTSSVFKNCNNCFGYKWVGQSTAQGPCTNSPEGNRYAKYSSVEQSTREITAWIKRRQKEGKFPKDLTTITTFGQYAQLLKNSGYYGDPVSVYTNGLAYWFAQISINILNPPEAVKKGATGLFLAGLFAYIFRKRLFGKKPPTKQ